MTIDGRPVGKTRLAGISLSPGTHALVFEHPSYQPLRRVVSIRTGEASTVNVDLRDEALKKR